MPARDVHRVGSQIPPRSRLIGRLRESIGAVVADRWHVRFADLAGGAGLLRQVEGTHPGRTQISTLVLRFYENAATCGLRRWSAWRARSPPGGRKSSPPSPPASPRRLRGHQPRDQNRRTLHLRLPQPRQPVPTCRRRHHPTRPRTPHHPHQRTPRPTQTPPRNSTARSSSMSREDLFRIHQVVRERMRFATEAELLTLCQVGWL